MPKRKIKDSLLPPDVEAAVMEQLRAIYSGEPMPLALPNADPSNRAYMYEGTIRAPPRAKTRGLSAKKRSALVKQHEAAVLAGELDPDEYIFHDQQHWPPREVILKCRKIKGRWQWVYRIKGQAGADLKVDPAYWELLKKRRDFDSECAKAQRRPPKRKSALDDRISAASAEVPKGRGRIQAIASRVGCNRKTVTRRLKEMGQ